MYYILDKNIGLRKYNDPVYTYLYYIKGVPKAFYISEKKFEFLKQCDGLHDIEANDDFRFMCYYSGVIKECEQGKVKLDPWQYMECDNLYFPSINLMITGKCNYNCLHCFNAKDNERLQYEWDFDELNKLFDDASLCGINSFTLTGGEPLLYKHFVDVVKKIYSKNMYVQEINTNGYFVTDELLMKLKDIGCKSIIKISFDGLTHHDYLRNYKGAEEIAKAAIKLCIKHGFETIVQMNIHKKNLDTFYETIDYLEKIGVSATRIIRTSESPRWIQTGKTNILSFEEYYDLSLEFAKKYLSEEHKMNINVWQVYDIIAAKHKFVLRATKNDFGKCSDNLLLCKGLRELVAIGANGNLYPCHQLSGYYDKYNLYIGNVKKESLQKLLSSGAYIKDISYTYKDLINSKGKCSTCKYVDLCAGGCPAIAKAFVNPSKNMMPPDISKCAFFEKGYLEKYKVLCDKYA